MALRKERERPVRKSFRQRLGDELVRNLPFYMCLIVIALLTVDTCHKPACAADLMYPSTGTTRDHSTLEWDEPLRCAGRPDLTVTDYRLFTRPAFQQTGFWI